MNLIKPPLLKKERKKERDLNLETDRRVLFKFKVVFIYAFPTIFLLSFAAMIPSTVRRLECAI